MDFEDFFGDIFDNLKIPTEEEMAKEKEELKRKKEIALEYKRGFLEYARSLPGSEKETKTNPIIEIRGEVVNGELKERAITFEESLDELFEQAFIEEEKQSQKR